MSDDMEKMVEAMLETGKEIVNNVEALHEEIADLKREKEALMKICDLAAWTRHGSRIYKERPCTTVSISFYDGISAAYREWEKEFGKD